MTKALLTELLQRRGLLAKKQAAALVEATITICKQQLLCGEIVRIGHFGRFEVQQRKARPGRNPHTGAALRLPARRRIVFRPARRFKELIDAQPLN